MDVLVTVGETEPQVAALTLGEPGEVSVTVVFPLDGSTVLLTFDAERFRRHTRLREGLGAFFPFR